MRVITGSARGRKLETLPGPITRPTTDMVKEAVFNIIQFDIEGRRVLDLFAGSGQMGIEALSRGAREAVFVDQKAEAIRVIRRNLEKTGFVKNAQVFLSDAFSWLSGGRGQFDLIFIDPPYMTNHIEKALNIIRKFDILSDGGIIICESSETKPTPAAQEPLRLLKEYKYGKIKISLFNKGVV
ncbi:MAG: 16S rRNA (guanine(966)-N(2))-methyltransferase RsmD [Oscillospiraceae bacterium]|jgi:16S rRNA (guanine966-N2)-methyltransferase